MTITLLIIILTVVASFYAWEKPEIKAKWMLNPALVHKRGEYYRFITSGLIHNDMMHLIFNMLTLYFFGRIIELIFGSVMGYELGTVVFLLFYVAAIVISDIPTFLKHRNNYGYNSLGASGGVTAVVFACILFFPTAPIRFFFIPFDIPGFVFAGLYLMYSAYMARHGNDYINHDAHLYGALFGIVFSIVVYPRVIFSFVDQLMNWRGFF